MPRRKGFTLIELLVVISIIALLISILLPALRRSRDTALVVACSANVRQIVQIYAAYANDEDDYVPIGWRNDQTMNYLFGRYNQYLQFGYTYRGRYANDWRFHVCPGSTDVDEIVMFAAWNWPPGSASLTRGYSRSTYSNRPWGAVAWQFQDQTDVVFPRIGDLAGKVLASDRIQGTSSMGICLDYAHVRSHNVGYGDGSAQAFGRQDFETYLRSVSTDLYAPLSVRPTAAPSQIDDLYNQLLDRNHEVMY
ncbi:MAG: prepilin-type N-terminal cleavage/methylation domain-containing protein [Phycisphaeraceae bacterium]|nr:prepilin-type N-terminal cleavage/methylation domain-containing protein [Phycisphaeraceae bacterium]